MPARGRGYLERARSLLVRAEARGGTLVAWGAARIYFAFEPTTIDDVIALVTKPGEETLEGEERFAFGVAQGTIEQVANDGLQANLAWGPALVAAGALAMAGRAGQVHFADRVKAVRRGELVLNGGRFAEEAGLRLRGLALDVQQPWKRDAAASVNRLADPSLVGAEADRAPAVRPGNYGVLVAPRGAGGTRRLGALAASFGDRALLMTPAGASLEPLGALRRAVSRAIRDDMPPALAPHAAALESLLSAEPLAADVAEDLVVALMGPRSPGGSQGVVLIDDAELVDPESLQVVAAAMVSAPGLPVVLRIAAAANIPAQFIARRAPEATVEVAPLSPEAAMALAGAFTGGALTDDARKRWATLSDGTPLGLHEALAHGLQSAELAWIGDRASPRRKSSGRGKARPTSHFITLRAHECSPAARTVLAAVALLGGEARVEPLGKIIEAAGQSLGVEACVSELLRSRWLLAPEPGWVALPSRTHVTALGQLLEAPLAAALHRAAAEVIEETETGFARLDAVAHAVAAGDLARAQRIVTVQQLGLGQARHTGAATRLRAMVDLAPVSSVIESTDEHTAVEREPLAEATAAERVEEPAPPPASEPTFVLLKGGPASAHMSASVPSPLSDGIESKIPTQQNPQALPPADSEPPTIADAAPVLTSLAQLQRTLTPHPRAKAALAPPTLAEQLRAALQANQQDQLERLLSSAGVGDVLAERVRAIARLRRGETGEALRGLRRVRHGPEVGAGTRSQSALALAIAYAAASRFEEALLEGLTALARAREAGHPRGEHACLTFLGRLYAMMSRPEEASRLREAAAGVTVA